MKNNYLIERGSDKEIRVSKMCDLRITYEDVYKLYLPENWICKASQNENNESFLTGNRSKTLAPPTGNHVSQIDTKTKLPHR